MIPIALKGLVTLYLLAMALFNFSHLAVALVFLLLAASLWITNAWPQRIEYDEDYLYVFRWWKDPVKIPLTAITACRRDMTRTSFYRGSIIYWVIIYTDGTGTAQQCRFRRLWSDSLKNLFRKMNEPDVRIDIREML